MTEQATFYKELYKLYCEDWHKNHNEGEPACFGEFLDNEYQDMIKLDKNVREEDYPYSKDLVEFDNFYNLRVALAGLAEAGKFYGFELLFKTDFLDEVESDFFFDRGYGFNILKSDFGLIRIECNGELRGSYKKGDFESEDIYEIRQILNTDRALAEALNNGELILEDNNWWELAFYDKDSNYMDEYDMVEPIAGDITEGIKTLLDWFMNTPDYIREIISDMKKGGE